MENRGFYAGPPDDNQTTGTAEDEDGSSDDEAAAKRLPKKLGLNAPLQGQHSPQVRRLFNLKSLRQQELAKKQKKARPQNNYPTRKEFYEHLNKARYDRQQQLQSFGIQTKAFRTSLKQSVPPRGPGFNMSSLTSKDLSFSLKQQASPTARKLSTVQARNQPALGKSFLQGSAFITQSTATLAEDSPPKGRKPGQKQGDTTAWDISHWNARPEQDPAGAARSQGVTREGFGASQQPMSLKQATMAAYTKNHPSAPRDTSFAALNNPDQKKNSRSPIKKPRAGDDSNGQNSD